MKNYGWENCDEEWKFKDRVKPYAYISYIGGVYATGCVNTLVICYRGDCMKDSSLNFGLGFIHG